MIHDPELESTDRIFSLMLRRHSSSCKVSPWKWEEDEIDSWTSIYSLLYLNQLLNLFNMVCKIRLCQGSARPEVVGFHWKAIRDNGLASLVKKHWLVNIYVLSRTIERFKCLNINFQLEHNLKQLPLRTSAARGGVIWRPVNMSFWIAL